MKKRWFYQIDILSPPPILYVFKEKRRPTYLGAILTIIMILFSLIFTIQLFVKWITHKDYIIGYSKISLNETNSFDLNDGLFVFNSEFVEKELNNNYYFKLYLINDLSELIELNYSKCNYFSEKNFKVDLDFDKSKYYCLDKNIKIMLSNYLNGNETYLSFKILKRNISYKPIYHEIPFKFIFSVPKIEHSNFQFPINITKFLFEFKLSTEYYTQIENYYKTIEYETLSGIISLQSKSSFIAFFDESLTIKEISNKLLNDSINDTIGEINFHLNLINIDKYSRTYPLIQEILSQIGGIISIFFQGTSLFMSIFASTKNNYVIFSHIVNKHNENIKIQNKISRNDLYQNLNFFNGYNTDIDISDNRKKKTDEKFSFSKSIYSTNKMLNIDSIENNNLNSNFNNIKQSSNTIKRTKTNINEEKKSTFEKIIDNNTISKGGILKKISLCNSFFIEIFPFKTRNKKILNFSEDFMRGCLGIENIIKTYLRMNQIMKLLNYDKRKKVDEMDYDIIQNIKKIESGEDEIEKEKKKKNKKKKIVFSV